MTRLIILLVLTLLTYVSSAFAADTKGLSGLTIMLENCIEKNPELRASYHNWKAADSAILYKTAIADPTVNFRHNFEPVQTRTGEQNQVLTISQMLPFPGKQKTSIRLHKQMSQIDKLHYEIKFRDIITEIKKSYAEVWFLLQAIKSAEANARLIELMAKEGISNSSSSSLMPILKAQSQLAQSANDLITYSELLEAEKEKLKALALVEELPEEWFVELPFHKIPENNDELLDQALKNRIEIQVARKSKDISLTRVRLAALENKPDIILGFSQSFTGNRPDLNNVYLKGEGTDPVGVFVQFNLPVWGNKNRSRINEAREKKAEATATLASIKDKTRASFFKLWFNLTNRKRLYQVYGQTILPQAQNAMISAQGLFQKDKTRFADYLEAAATAYAIKIASSRAQADYFISVSELERMIGVPFSLQNEDNPK